MLDGETNIRSIRMKFTKEWREVKQREISVGKFLFQSLIAVDFLLGSHYYDRDMSKVEKVSQKGYFIGIRPVFAASDFLF